MSDLRAGVGRGSHHACPHGQGARHVQAGGGQGHQQEDDHDGMPGSGQRWKSAVSSGDVRLEATGGPSGAVLSSFDTPSCSDKARVVML